MNIETASRILGIEPNASARQIEVAKRKLIQALHPDKHPQEQKEIFEKMTRDVIEASEFLVKLYAQSASSANDADSVLEQILFAEGVPIGSGNNTYSTGNRLVRYDRRYANDKTLAIAILSIDYDYSWQTSSTIFGGPPQLHYGSALAMVILNRTNKGMNSFNAGQHCYLIDDKGFQYSPSDTSFYWIDARGQFNRHSDYIAPNAKVDGFVLFPRLRKESRRFVRWVLHGKLWVDNEMYEGNYDVILP